VLLAKNFKVVFIRRLVHVRHQIPKTLMIKLKIIQKVTKAVIETNHGKIVLNLLPDIAPETVRNFIKLAKSGFYDGTLFHRVIPGFMIQGGDPNSKQPDKKKWGIGGPGYTIKAEFNPRSHLRGVVSMARAMDPNSAGSQFFIVTTDSTFLDRQYTAFGEVIEGMGIADKIVNLQKDENDCPFEEAKMLRISIE
jgi:peptidyl-prolyl cis-trans isomerase B (cyclophilin B)